MLHHIWYENELCVGFWQITVPVAPGRGTPVTWMRSVWTHLVVIPVFVGQDSGESVAPVKVCTYIILTIHMLNTFIYYPMSRHYLFAWKNHLKLGVFLHNLCTCISKWYNQRTLSTSISWMSVASMIHDKRFMGNCKLEIKVTRMLFQVVCAP